MSSKTLEIDKIRVIFTRIENFSSTGQVNLKNFFQSCIIDDTCKILDLQKKFDAPFELFLGISNKKDSAGHDKWKACCVKSAEKFLVRSSSHIVTHEEKQNAFDDLRHVFASFHENYDDDGCFTIIEALKATEIFSHETVEQMRELIIEAGLDLRLRTKYAAGRFIEILKDFIESGNDVKVNEVQLNNLIHILTSPNFALDEEIVQLKTVKVLTDLKIKKFAEFSNQNIEKVQKFLTDNRDTYKEDIRECYKSIQENPNDKSFHSKLTHVAQSRIDFLTSIAMFSGQVQSDDLIEVMLLKNSSNLLKVKENELKMVCEQIDAENLNSNFKASTKIRLSNEFNDLMEEVKFHKVIESSKFDLKVDEFLIEFGKYYEESSEGIFGVIKAGLKGKMIEIKGKFIKKSTNVETDINQSESGGVESENIEKEETVEVAAEIHEGTRDTINNDDCLENEIDSKVKSHQIISEVSEALERPSTSEHEQVEHATIKEDSSKIKIFKGYVQGAFTKLKSKVSVNEIVEVKELEIPPFISSLLTFIDNHKLSRKEAQSILSIMMKSNFKSFNDIPENILKAFDKENEETDEGFDEDEEDSNTSDNGDDNSSHEVTTSSDEGRFSSEDEDSQEQNVDFIKSDSLKKSKTKKLGIQGLKNRNQKPINKKNETDYVEKLIDFGLEKSLVNPTNYIKFISKLLVNDENYEKIIKVLKKYGNFLEGHSKLINELLDAIDSKSTPKVFDKIEKIIQSNENLPLKAFVYLNEILNEDKTYDLLNKILKGDTPKIPTFFIDSIITELNKSETIATFDKIQTIDHFIMNGFTKINKVEDFIENSIKSDENKKCENSLQFEALQTVSNAIQIDQQISPKLLQAIKSIDRSKSNRLLINFITDAETKLSKITSGKTSKEEKLAIFAEMEENPVKFQDEDTLETLIELILYDEPVTKRAFEVLTKICPENYEFKEEEICKIAFFGMKCNANQKTVENFLNKFSLNFEDLLDICDDDGLSIKLQEAYENMRFIELTIDNLNEVLTQDKLVKDEISLLIYALKDDDFSEHFKKIIQKLKNLELSETEIKAIESFLKDNLNHSQYDEILQLLPSDIRKNFQNSLNNPEIYINELIKILESNPTDEMSIEKLSYETLAEKFTENHISSIKKICLDVSKSIIEKENEIKELQEEMSSKQKKGKKYTISLKIEILQSLLKIQRVSLFKILKILLTLEVKDEGFSQDLLANILDDSKIDEIIKELIKNNPCNSLELSLALLYIERNRINLCDEIFTNYKPNLWSHQLFIFILLYFCEYDEFDLGDFMKILRKTSRFIQHRILVAIIDKIEGKIFNLKEIIDLCVILQSNEKVFKSFTSCHPNDLPIPSRLHESWLKSSLLDKCTGKDIQDYKILMRYRPTLIDHLLNADRKNQMRASDFIKIFKALQQCSTVDDNQKCNKLYTMCFTENTNWLPKIELFLIDDLIMTKLEKFDKPNLKKLQKGLQRIYHTGWSVNSINAIVSRIKSNDDILKTCKALRTLYEYEIGELHCNVKGERALEVVTKYSSYIQMYKTLHQIVFHNNFRSTHQKSVDDLCQEILSKNPDIKFILKKEFDKVQEAYNGPSAVLKTKSNIKEISKSDIENWSFIIKKPKPGVESYQDLLKFPVNVGEASVYCFAEQKASLYRNPDCSTCSIYEKIAVLMRAFKIFKKYEPRDIQILSLLLLLNPDDGKGRLVQINTGEGKTTIVAMLAVIKALEGLTVDVITSSPELAKPQSKELKNFYKMFKLTVSHNGDDKNEKEKFIRYEADIVYGAATSFQGDILRDEYSKMGTRNGRQCQVAIVDEVDSMLIDGRNHIVMLSSSMPAMNYLEHFYATIWMDLKIFEASIKEKDGKNYFVQKIPIDDQADKTDEKWTPIEKSKETFIKEKLMAVIKEEIKRDKSDLKIPSHLKELILKQQLDQWIRSAIFGKFNSRKNQNYILDKGRVIPVDSDNTGVLQENMNWSNGLHQFLQIKHGAKITPESLTTNYISNVAFFKRYGSNLFGLTGTLGSENAQKLLERTYKVDSVIIPPFMVKRYKELFPIIADNENDWYDEIVESNMIHLQNERAVLIITRYISEAQELEKKFGEEFDKLKIDKKKIRVYKTEHESSAVESEVDSGDLIIATNIAGRGTDIKTSKSVESHGGLHVCVISLPSNERVEQQNVGRTSRTGNLGTSQFIIHHKNQSDIKLMKQYRDDLEGQELILAEQQMKKTLVKDDVFVRFCRLLQIVPNITTRKAVENRFGIWLQINGEKSENLLEEYKKFDRGIRADVFNLKTIKNPVYHILLGNKCIENERYLEAIDEFTKAIELEDEFSEYAYYNRGYARLAYYCGYAGYDVEIKKSVEDFKTARAKIKNREMELQIIQLAKDVDGKVLSEQVSHKMILYSIHKSAIDQAIGLDPTEHFEVMKEFEDQMKELEELLKKLPEFEKDLSEKENFDEKLQNLEEKQKTLNFEDKNFSEIQTQIDNLQNSKEYEAYKDLQEQIRLLKLIPSRLEDIKMQREATQENFNENKLGVINKALNENAQMKVVLSSIDKSLPSEESIKFYKDEIDEFSANGMLGAFQVQKLPPINWWSAFGVLALGVLQIIAGGALCIFTCGLGASLGSNMLSEGISDVITGVRDGIVNRSFSWKQYGIQKAINYISSALLMGLSALKSAAKDVFKTLLGGAKSAVNKMETFTFTKEGWKLATKKIGLEFGKKVGQDIVRELVNLGIDRAVIPLIEKALTLYITPKITDWLQKNEQIKKMLEIDVYNRNSYYESKIMVLVDVIIHNEKTLIRKLAEKIAEKVLDPNEAEKAKEMLDYENSKNGVEVLTEIVGGVSDRFITQNIPLFEKAKKACEVTDFITFLHFFMHEFEKKIGKEIKIDENDLMLLKKTVNETTTTSTQSEQENLASNVEIFQNLPNPESLRFEKFLDEDIKESNLIKEQPEEQIKLEKLHLDSRDLFSKIASKVSNRITTKINGSLIAPYASSLVARGVNSLTANLDQALQTQIDTYRCARRVEFRQNKDKDNRVPDEENMGQFDEDIKGIVEEYIKNFSDGEKVGLQDLGSVSDALGVQITIFDEKGKIVRIIGEGTPVDVRYEEGHYSLPDGSDPPGGSDNKNDCLFNVIAHQTGQVENASEMRFKTVKAMEANIDTLANQYTDVTFIKIHKPQYLHEGGLREPNRKGVAEIIKGNEDLLKGAKTYYNFKRLFKNIKRKSFVDFHHEPANGSYGDPKQPGDKLAIALDHEDHQNLMSTRNADYVKFGRTMCNRKGGFNKFLLIGCLDIYFTSLKSGNAEYKNDIISLIEEHEKKGNITHEEAEKSKNVFQSEYLPRTIDEFNSEYVEKHHSDTFEGSGGIRKMFEAKLNGDTGFRKIKAKTYNLDKYNREKRAKKDAAKDNPLPRF